MRYAKRSKTLIIAGWLLIGWLAYALHSGYHKSSFNQYEAACESLKPERLYDSLESAISFARYRLYADERMGNAFYANNSAQHLSAYFMPNAARVTVKHNANSDGLRSEATEQTKTEAPVQSEDSQLSLRFIGAGYGDAIRRAQGQPAITAAGDRLTYTHQLTSSHDSASGGLSRFANSAICNSQSAIEEWYVNKPEGIEHGFTFNEPVGEKVEGELLKVELEFDGDFLAQAVEEGKAIVFKREDGKAQLSYAGLKAFDADGLELKATMAVKGGVLRFEVDDTKAVYPIIIDPTFTQQQKLVPGATASDSFGTDVAITGDTAVVGAPLDDVSANVDQGSIFVFVRSGTTWSQQARLFANDGAANDTFGFSVAVSANTIVVGAPNDDGTSADQGSAYVFVRTGTIWSQQAKLTASDGALFDLLGYDVAIEGDYAAIAAAGDNNGSFEGTVRIFHRVGTTWTNESTVVGDPVHRQASDFFATSIALSGSTLVVGAPEAYLSVVEVDIESFYTVGKVHILVRSGTTWNTQQVILGDYQPVTFGTKADGLGRAVAINGNTLAAGSWRANIGPSGGNVEIWFRSGATWTLQLDTYGSQVDAIGFGVAIDGDTAVYTSLGGNKVLFRTGTNWAQQATLTSVGESVSLSGNTLLSGSFGFAKVEFRTGTTWAEQSELTAQEGAIADQFGHSVAINGDTAVVGVPFKDVGGASARGAVFVFKRSGSTWQQEAQLTASDGAGGHQFGHSVAIEGDTIVVGAPQPLAGHGAVYVFTRSGTSWTQRTKIIAADGQPVDLFGNSVALFGNTLVIGSPLDDNEAIGGFNNGSAYVFTGSGATWIPEAHLRAIEEADADQFGYDVDINGETIAVGARFVANGESTLQGAAYVFSRIGTTWTQQARLLASDGATGDYFGESLSVNGNTLAVGSQFHNIGSNSNQGAVYIFNRSGSTWTESQMLTATDGAVDDIFGVSVALQRDALLVGASGDDFASTNAQGSAYVFIPVGATWAQVQKLFALDGATNDGYGNAVALNDRTLLIGASGDDFGSTADQGSAFVLVPSGPSVWTGANSTNWSNGGNWDSSIAPNVFDDVLFPASGVANEAVLNINANIHSLTIEAGRSLTINAGRTLTVNGNLTLNGTIIGGGTLIFKGASLANNNLISNVSVQFSGTGVQQLSGSGLFLSNTITLLSASTLRIASDHVVDRIVINNGGTLNFLSANILSFIGSGVVLTNNGTITGTGTVAFDGTSAQSTSGAITLHNLTIDNAAGVTLGADSTVNGVLNLADGDLNTGPFTLTMPATATSTAASNHNVAGDVIGNLKRTGFTTANTLSFGNPFNTLAFTSGTPPTEVTMNLAKQAPVSFSNAVRRTYTITPNGGSGYAGTVQLRYKDSELNGNAEPTLFLWRNSGASWINLGATMRSANPENWVKLVGIAQFSPWVISGPTAPCGYGMSPTSRFFPISGGPGNINISTTSSCNWAATATEEWITITSADNGSGNGVVTYEVRENFTGGARQAFVSISGNNHVIVQDGGLGEDCGYSISPSYQSFPAIGGSGAVNIFADERCAWQAVASTSWIIITSSSVGIGNATMSFTVAPNTGGPARKGTITIGGQVFAVKQKAG